MSAVPSVDRLTASSDFELKLVVNVAPGTDRVFTTVPVGVSWSINIGDVIPKLPSTVSLFQTLLVLPMAGKAPLFVAVPVPQLAVAGQFGGSGWPMVTEAAVPVYTLRLTARLPGVKPENELWANAGAQQIRTARQVEFNVFTILFTAPDDIRRA